MNAVPTSSELVELLTAARNLLSNLVYGGSGGVKLDGRDLRTDNRTAARIVLQRLQSAVAKLAEAERK